MTTIQITWPDLKLPPINLKVLVPAWFFYASEKEREDYFNEILNPRCRDDNKEQGSSVH